MYVCMCSFVAGDAALRHQVAEYASTHLSRNLEVELANMGSLQGSEQVGYGRLGLALLGLALGLLE
jgi:hypothetical protein